MFFNKKRKYRGNAAVLLPAFGLDLEELGAYGVADVLDTAWLMKLNQYEAALLVAVSYAGGLYLREGLSAGDAFVNNTYNRIKDDWIKKGVVDIKKISEWPALLDKRRQQALNKYTESQPQSVNKQPDLSRQTGSSQPKAVNQPQTEIDEKTLLKIASLFKANKDFAKQIYENKKIRPYLREISRLDENLRKNYIYDYLRMDNDDLIDEMSIDLSTDLKLIFALVEGMRRDNIRKSQIKVTKI